MKTSRRVRGKRNHHYKENVNAYRPVHTYCSADMEHQKKELKIAINTPNEVLTVFLDLAYGQNMLS